MYMNEWKVKKSHFKNTYMFTRSNVLHFLCSWWIVKVTISRRFDGGNSCVETWWVWSKKSRSTGLSYQCLSAFFQRTNSSVRCSWRLNSTVLKFYKVSWFFLNFTFIFKKIVFVSDSSFIWFKNLNSLHTLW